LWADVAITSGGLTKYDAAVCGTPSLVISQNEYEHEYTSEFESLRSIDHLGLADEVTSQLICDRLCALVADQGLRTQMSKSGKQICGDGLGVKNTAKAILEVVEKAL
jgi:spore coat polysaccharide biosynthesis predicted glycosyltransferase SpsG